jgi:hypothetical protein
MALDAYLQKQSEPESVGIKVRMVGTGAAAPTKVLGQGITISRTGVGAYTLTFSESPGAFECVNGLTLQATTPGDIKNHSVVFGAYNATARTLALTFWDAAAAAHDLAALEWLAFTVFFKRAGTGV